MLTEYHVGRDAFLQRLPAGLKLLVMCAAGAGLFFVTALPWLAAAVLLAWGLTYWAAGRLRFLWRPLRNMLPVIVLLGLFTGWAQGAVAGWAAVLRILALFGLGLALMLSTRSGDLLSALERALMPLQRLGLLDASRVALACALVLRFVPEIARAWQEIGEAQAARGGGNVLQRIEPLLARMLRQAEAIAQAVDARR